MLVPMSCTPPSACETEYRLDYDIPQKGGTIVETQSGKMVAYEVQLPPQSYVTNTEIILIKMIKRQGKAICP